MLRAFLDRYGFDYEFVSSTERYKGGQFDEALKNVLLHYQDIMAIMLPTIRAERQATYSPVLPISPRRGIVLQVPLEVVNAEAVLILFEDQGAVLLIVSFQAAAHCKGGWFVPCAGERRPVILKL